MELVIEQVPPVEIPEAVYYRNRYVFQISLGFEDTERRVELGELRVAWSDDTGEYLPRVERHFNSDVLHVAGLTDRENALAFFGCVYELNADRSYDEFVAWWRTQDEKTIAGRLPCEE